jgi:hypothetical protein
MQKSYEPISLALIPNGTLILLIPSFWVMRFLMIVRTIHAKSTVYTTKKDSSGKEPPHKILIKYGDKEYAYLKVNGRKLQMQFNSDALQKRYLSCLQLSFKNLKMPSL